MNSLDPADWSDLRALGHRMVDDMIDHLQTLRDGPVWQPMPLALRAELRRPLPRDPSPLESVYQDFQRLVQPYATGNLHPRFMGWVHGGGNPVGMLAELLAAGLNANLGGRATTRRSRSSVRSSRGRRRCWGSRPMPPACW